MGRDATAGGDVPEVKNQVLGCCGRSGHRRPSVCVNSLTAELTRLNKSRPGQVLDRWNHTRRTLDSTNAPTFNTSGRTLSESLRLVTTQRRFGPPAAVISHLAMIRRERSHESA